jgi:hypothetical protein
MYLQGNNQQIVWSYSTPIYRARLPVLSEKASGISEITKTPEAAPLFELRVPKIPLELLEITCGAFRWVLDTGQRQLEAAMYLCYQNGNWRCKMPYQEISTCNVSPEPISALDHVGMVIHSHGLMPAFFSSTDDNGEDDGFIFGVVGDLKNRIPQFKFRVGDRGYFLPVRFEDLWEYERRLVLC